MAHFSQDADMRRTTVQGVQMGLRCLNMAQWTYILNHYMISIFTMKCYTLWTLLLYAIQLYGLKEHLYGRGFKKWWHPILIIFTYFIRQNFIFLLGNTPRFYTLLIEMILEPQQVNRTKFSQNSPYITFCLLNAKIYWAGGNVLASKQYFFPSKKWFVFSANTMIDEKIRRKTHFKNEL